MNNNNTKKKMLLVPIGFKFKPSNNQCLQYLEAQLCGWTLSELPNIVEKDLYADHPSVTFGPDDNYLNADEYKESNKVCFVRYFYTTLQKKAKDANNNGSRYIRVVEGGLGTWLNQKPDNIYNESDVIGLRRYYKYKPERSKKVVESNDNNVEWKMYEFSFTEGFMPKDVLKGREDMVLCKIIKEVKVDQVVKQQGQVLINNPWITTPSSNNKKRVVEQSFGSIDNVEFEQSHCKKQAIEKNLDYNDGTVFVHGNSGLNYNQAAWCDQAIENTIDYNDGSFYPSLDDQIQAQTQTRLCVNEGEVANLQLFPSAINSKPFTYYDDQAPNPGNNNMDTRLPDYSAFGTELMRDQTSVKGDDNAKISMYNNPFEEAMEWNLSNSHQQFRPPVKKQEVVISTTPACLEQNIGYSELPGHFGIEPYLKYDSFTRWLMEEEPPVKNQAVGCLEKNIEGSEFSGMNLDDLERFLLEEPPVENIPDFS